MKDVELREQLAGLFFHDVGYPNGVHDEDLKRHVSSWLLLSSMEDHLFLSRLVRDMWLTEDAFEQGYGLKDAMLFVGWVEEEMGIEL